MAFNLENVACRVSFNAGFSVPSGARTYLGLDHDTVTSSVLTWDDSLHQFNLVGGAWYLVLADVYPWTDDIASGTVKMGVAGGLSVPFTVGGGERAAGALDTSQSCMGLVRANDGYGLIGVDVYQTSGAPVDFGGDLMIWQLGA